MKVLPSTSHLMIPSISTFRSITIKALQEKLGLVYGPMSAKYLTAVSGGSYIAATYALGARHQALHPEEYEVIPLLGTPRMIIDQTGTLANVKRHDYRRSGPSYFAARTLGVAYQRVTLLLRPSSFSFAR